MKEISKGIFALGLFLYLKNHQTLVISDLHIGYEESLNKEGIFIPRSNFNHLMIRITDSIRLLKNNGYKLRRIVLNGDIIHSFNKHSQDEKYVLKKTMDFLAPYGEIVIIKGNHDKLLEYILKSEIKILDKLILKDILITHGDIIDKNVSDKSIKTIIVGHDHPSITLRSGLRTEKYKCFLKGKFNSKILIMMPSCNSLIEGTDIQKEKMLSPYVYDIKNFDVYIIGDEIYDFGLLKNID
jgi:putative SbcD/Mre11-related phosphoesterase